MTIPEAFKVLEGIQGEISVEHQFHGANLQFKGFEPKLVQVDLRQPELAELSSFVEADRKHHPEEMLAVLDEVGNPRLAIVKGSRERWSKKGPLGFGVDDEHIGDADYLHVYRVDPREDGKIFVEGRERVFHPFEDRRGHGMDASFYMPENFREGGVIEVTQKGKKWSIKATQGRVTHPQRS